MNRMKNSIGLLKIGVVTELKEKSTLYLIFKGHKKPLNFN